jgi:phenylacetate-CoA ligase
MAQGIRRPHEAVDFAAIERMYPPPPEYFETAFYDGRDSIERRQLARLQDKAWRAYEVPFFRRRWGGAGFHPRDITTLDDLWRAPSYTVDDIRKSIEDNPPFGDYQGVLPADARREPMRVFMSGGTTGKSRPTFYTAWDRMTGAVFTARALYALGIRPGDTVLNSWSYGTHNGAFCFDEALYQWLNCVVLTTSTGNVTSTEKQVELAIQYGATAILTTGDYLLRIADAAKDLGYDPAVDLKIRALPNIGDPEVLSTTFGAEYFRSYGFHEVQWVASECAMHDGLHVYEDGFIVQIVDVETGETLPDGELGSICITELYKTGSSQFRYNIMDLSYLYPVGQCGCGSWLRKIGPFAGRGDNMVKLRGINVWPEAVGAIACSVDGALPDYFVRAVRAGTRDELIVSVVSDRPVSEFEAVQREIERRLQQQLGLKIAAAIVGPGELDELTEIHTAPKSKRFRDERPALRG